MKGLRQFILALAGLSSYTLIMTADVTHAMNPIFLGVGIMAVIAPAAFKDSVQYIQEFKKGGKQ